MADINYRNVDRHLVKALPALLVPHARCIAQDFDGGHPGQYNVFEPVFRTWLDILLALPTGPIRDDLLQRSFDFVELMLQSTDHEVPNLAKIAVFEGQATWWFARAATYIGPHARAFVEAFESRWLEAEKMPTMPNPNQMTIDIFGVREVIARTLGDEVSDIAAVPGVGNPYDWRRMTSLHQARLVPDGVILLSCFGTSEPYVIAPAISIVCNPVTLLQLARDLAECDPKEVDQRERGESSYYSIPIGERVWNMRVGDDEHARYNGTLWIAPQFIACNVDQEIIQVLDGKRDRIRIVPDIPS